MLTSCISFSPAGLLTSVNTVSLYFPGPGGKTVGLVLGFLLLIAFVITAGLLYYFKCRKKPKPSKSIGGNGEEMAFTGVQNNSEQMAHNEAPTQPDS